MMSTINISSYDVEGEYNESTMMLMMIIIIFDGNNDHHGGSKLIFKCFKRSTMHVYYTLQMLLYLSS